MALGRMALSRRRARADPTCFLIITAAISTVVILTAARHLAGAFLAIFMALRRKTSRRCGSRRWELQLSGSLLERLHEFVGGCGDS